MMAKKYLLLFVATLIFVQAAAGQSDPPTNLSEIDLVHYGDVIDVDVVGSLDFDWRGTLNPEGFLDGLERAEQPVYALCRTESDIAAAITSQYSKVLRDPKVVVRIVDRSNRAVAILDGAVRKPQRFQIKRAVNLSELIVLSGGITDRSNGEIRIFRPQSVNCLNSVTSNEKQRSEIVKAVQSNGSQMLNIRISDLLMAKEGSNPQILSGDIITMTQADPIYVMGGVNSPKQISSKSKVTLTRAIAGAGGLSKDAEEDRITIFRRSGRQASVINVDLQKVRKGQTVDPELKPFDVVDVGQKGRGKPRLPAVFEAGSDPARLTLLPLRVID